MAYIGVSPQFATLTVYCYTIALAGTTVTGFDDLGKALTYTPGYVTVYVNGIKLIDTQDYIASSGSSVVFASAVQIGDVVEIIAYGTYSISNQPVLSTQVQAEAGTDNLTFMSPLRVQQRVTSILSTQAQSEAGTDNTTIMTPLRTQQHTSMWGNPQHGRLIYSSATLLKFIPYGGSCVKVNGKIYTIPAAGISIPNTGVLINNVSGNLAASTLFLVGLMDNGSGTLVPYMTQGGSHSTSTTPGNLGVEIANAGDAVSIIGMILSNASGQFQSDTTYRFVSSWFNRRNITVLTGVSTIASSYNSPPGAVITGTPWMLNWGDEAVSVSVNGLCYVDTGGGTYLALHIGQDGTGVSPQSVAMSHANASWYGPYSHTIRLTPAEGAHYYHGSGWVSSGTGQYNLYVSGMTRG